MGLFNFVSGWKKALIDEPLDRKMAETLKVGVTVARAEVHVISGYLQSTIYGEYDQARKVVMLHADAKYALIEETRRPSKHHSDHHYLAPAAAAMGKVWNGNFELHFPHALLGNIATGRTYGLVGQERRLRSRLNGLAKRTKIVSRRWHRRRFDDATEVDLIL